MIYKEEVSFEPTRFTAALVVKRSVIILGFKVAEKKTLIDYDESVRRYVKVI